jgi:hypothetical protein
MGDIPKMCAWYSMKFDIRNACLSKRLFYLLGAFKGVGNVLKTMDNGYWNFYLGKIIMKVL